MPLYHGNYGPVKEMQNGVMLRGYTEQEYSGTNISVEGTYRDNLSFMAVGEHSQETNSGSNLLPFPYYEMTKTANGVTYTVNADGSIHMKGETTTYSSIRLWIPYNLEDGVEYERILFAEDKTTQILDNTQLGFPFRYYNSEGTAIYASRTFTWQEEYSEPLLYLQVPPGVTIDMTVYPYVCRKDQKVDHYEPYNGGFIQPSPDCPSDIIPLSNPVVKVGETETVIPHTLYGNGTINDTFENDVLIDGVRKSRFTKKWQEATVIDSSKIARIQSVNSNGVVNVQLSSPVGYFVKNSDDNFICTHFTEDTAVIANATREAWYLANRTTMYFRLFESRIGGNTLDHVNAWFDKQVANGTPVMIAYELETPIVTLDDPVPLYTVPKLTDIVSDVNISTHIKQIETSK